MAFSTKEWSYLSTIADFTYPLIPSGTSLSDSVDISGQSLDKNIIAIIENMDLKNEANVIKDPRGVAIELDGDICFGSASTQIQKKLEIVLNKVATELLISEQDFRMVIVEGHTDSQKIPKELKDYLSKIKDEDLYAYNVYQIEGEGRNLFSKIDGDENTIMGLPIKNIKEYLGNFK